MAQEKLAECFALVSRGECGGNINMRAEAIFADFGRLEDAIGLKKGFIENLYEEDDWSFVVKAEAIIEASVGHLIITKSDPALSNFFSKMSLSSQFGKLAVARELKLVSNETETLIRVLSKVRNDYVHDVRYISYSLKEYFQAEPATVQNLLHHIMRLVEPEERNVIRGNVQKMIEEEPKVTLVVITLLILAEILFQIHPEESLKASEKLKNAAPIIIIGIIIAVILAKIDEKSNSAGANSHHPPEVHE